MSVIGTGVDLVECARIERSIERFGDRFLQRVFTDGEIKYSMSMKFPARHLAARFAAKEAAMKALGTGWNRGVRWVDIEVCRQPGGRPTIAFHGRAGEIAKELGAAHVALSISHTADQAIAQVILEN